MLAPSAGLAGLEGQHYWSGTGNKGNELDLAGLVCNTLRRHNECINPLRGERGGDTWAKRTERLKDFEEELLRQNNL
jgi:hypothetical protein